MTKKKGNASPAALNTRSKVFHSSPSTDVSTNDAEVITQQYLRDQLVSLKAEINKVLVKQKDEIIDYLTNENILLKAEIMEIQKKMKTTENENLNLKKDVVSLQQYVRRNNIEFCGIPDNINNKDLQEKVIEIAQSIDVKINPKEIEACHRLPKGPKDKNCKTIVRFVNRKSCELLHAQKNKLKNVNLDYLGINNAIYINSNLCPYNKFIWGKCKKLLKDKIIDRFWVYNGFVYFASDENDKGTKVQHLADLQKTFPGYDFSSKY